MSDKPEDQPGEDKPQDDHTFWPTQPLRREQVSEEARLVEQIDKAQVPKAAIPTPPYLKFEFLDIKKPEQLDEIYIFLRDHYVGDAKGWSRFEYSKEFLTWWLGSQANTIVICLRYVPMDVAPQALKDSVKEGEMVGFITGLPIDYRVRQLLAPAQSVDFLSVHHCMRANHIAPLLIQETTRRSYRQGIYSAVFTAAFTAKQDNPIIPPVCKVKYYHRLLNPVKLAQCQFTRQPNGMSNKDFELHYKLPYVQSSDQKAFRPMVKKDIDAVYELYIKEQERYVIQQIYSKPHFTKIFTNIPNVVHTYVYEKDKQILGFISWYIVDTQMLKPEINALHKYIRNGHTFQYAAADDKLLLSLNLLMLHEMAKQGIDVATNLNVCRNALLIEKHAYDCGDGALSYHCFNLDWGKDVTED